MRPEQQQFGRYQVRGLLGRGGMAAVYRAHDPALRRDVALKVLYPQFSHDEAVVERFEREAVLSARLDHPNIVPIYDVGETDGSVYLAMKLLEGTSLGDLLRLRGKLPPDEAMAIIDQIASALDYAHGRGIIHRDIKPANIILEDEPGSQYPRALLADFGIAKSLDAPGLTTTGFMLGTPDYMAPEQIINQNVDHHADVYALGVLAFRCFTGQRPFEGGTDEVLYGHLQGTAPDPSVVDPSLPPAIGRVIQTAMARNPLARYSSAGAFAHALHAAFDRQPAAATPTGSPTVAARPPEHMSVSSATATVKGPIVPPGIRPATGPIAPTMPPPERRRRGPWLPILVLLAMLGVGGIVAMRAGAFGTTPPTPQPTLPAAETTPILPEPTATNEPTATATGEPSAAPSATATNEPTATPSATATPTDQPTRTPKPTATRAPTATRTPATPTTAPPTATPQPPTATPAPPTSIPVPTLLACPIPPTSGFGMLWASDLKLQQRLGCPLAAEQASTTVEQQFQRGRMLWYQLNGTVYVLDNESTGRALVYPPNALSGPDSFDGQLDATCVELQNDFAVVWNTHREVNTRIGCATSPEVGPSDGAIQRFEQGTMLFTPAGFGRGKTIFVLFNNGTFERYDDPNQ